MMMKNDDWPEVKAAALRAGWRPSHTPNQADEPTGLWRQVLDDKQARGLRGPCPVTGEPSCTIEPGKRANDGVLMRCWAGCAYEHPETRKWGLNECYEPHKAALLTK